jgi:ABC-type Zn uptake system ZnuABC Zn-binding protein ZnuA
MMRKILWMLGCLFVTALSTAAVAGCSDGEPSSTGAQASEAGALRVVTTVSPITSLVENIGGTRIVLEGIVPEGVNSHTFEPAPSVARLLAEADLIVLNGLFLEEPSLKMAEANKRESALILTLGDDAVERKEWVFDFSFPESDGRPNPHLWTDPLHALKYAELIRTQLVFLDPPNLAYYDENFQLLKQRLEDLDRRIAAAVRTIPPENRKLLTYHDSFPMFSARYGLEVIGAVQPSDFTEPSAREVARLIDQVKETGVPAIFGSAVFPSPVMEQIAKEGGARFVDELRDDDLPGEPGDARHTYMGMMVANVEAMVPALGGSAEALNGFDPGLVFLGESRAKYPK